MVRINKKLVIFTLPCRCFFLYLDVSTGWGMYNKIETDLQNNNDYKIYLCSTFQNKVTKCFKEKKTADKNQKQQ